MPQAVFERDRDAVPTAEIQESQSLDVLVGAEPGADDTGMGGAELEAAFAMFGTIEAAPRGQSRYLLADPFSADAANDCVPERRMPMPGQRGMHIDPRMPMQLLKTLDWAISLLAAEAAARWGAGPSLMQMNMGEALPFAVTALSLKAGLWLTDAYRSGPATMRPDRAIGGLTLGVFIALIGANALSPNARDAGALSAVLPAAAMLLASLHATFSIWVRAAHRKGVFAETIVLIGATEAAARFATRAARSGDARIVAIADDRLQRAPFMIGDIAVGGCVEALLSWPGLPHVDRIVIAVTPKAEDRVREILARLKALPNRVDLLLDYEAKGILGRGADRLAGAPLVRISGHQSNALRSVLKRAQDLIVGAMLLAAFALPILIIAAAILIESKGKGAIIHRQRRHGFNNRVFTAYKFRTMQRGEQVTRVGAFLRRTGLDNLPQLINVMRGEMSIVGPRPHDIGLQIANRSLSDIVAHYAHRHRVKPGLIGWAQLSGVCGQPRAASCVRKCVKLDLDYVARSSLLFDLEIMAKTVLAAVGTKRASQPPPQLSSL